MRGLIATIGLSLFTGCDLSIDVKVDDEEDVVDTNTQEEEICSSLVEVEGVENTWNTTIIPGQEHVTFVRVTIEVSGETVMYHPLVGFQGPLTLQETPLLSHIVLVDESGGNWNQSTGELDMDGQAQSQWIELESFALPDGRYLMDLEANLSEDAWDTDEVQGSIIFNGDTERFSSPFGCNITGIQQLQNVEGPTMTVRH